MTDVSSVAANLDAVQERLRDFDERLVEKLDELTAAAQCLTPRQVYTAIALHALLSEMSLPQLILMGDSEVNAFKVADTAARIGDTVYRRELEALNRNRP